MDEKARAKATTSTQDHLEVREIIDDLVITKTGSVAMVIQTTAINFDLLAEYEQDSKMFAFAGLLNSLNFRIQILIRTKRIDISSYVDNLKAQENREMTEGLRKQLKIYTTFIQNLIVQNDVLDKNFYIVIPYSPGVSLPGSNILNKRKDKETQTQFQSLQTNQMLEKAKIFLEPKRDHILKQLSRMGLFGHQLTNKELISEFYTTYNPGEDNE